MLTLSERWLTTQTSVFAARRDRDRLEADRDRADVVEPARVDVEDLEPVVGRVDGEQTGPVRRLRERPDLAGLEGGERR